MDSAEDVLGAQKAGKTTSGPLGRYPWLIHRLTYRRTNHANLHVRGYKEEGTTTTPFDMTVLNDFDRSHLAGDVVDRVPRLQRVGAHFKQLLRHKLIEHTQYIARYGDDMPGIRDWRWPFHVQ
jgi:xylulose-5-phosphate/fructose-6-phosphate phosphoketolase